MVNIIQILFIVLGVAMAIYNAIWLLREIVRMIDHPMPRTQKIGRFVIDEDPGETARKIVMQDSNDMAWDWDGFDGFDC